MIIDVALETWPNKIRVEVSRELLAARKDGTVRVEFPTEGKCLYLSIAETDELAEALDRGVYEAVRLAESDHPW